MMNLRKDQWLTIAIVAVVVTTFALVIYLPQYRQLSRLRQSVASAEETLQRDRCRVSELGQLRGDVKRIDERMAVYTRKLPEQPDVGPFLKDISNYAQLCGLEGASFQPQKLRPGDQYNQIPVEMRFKGTFPELFRFLRQARNMGRLTQVRSLNVRNDAKLEGNCQIDVSMVIFNTGRGGV